VVVYVDENLVCRKIIKENMEHTRLVFKAFSNVENLYVNMEKCKPLKEELVYIDFGVGIFCYNP
jgi:hypothetical protein